MIELILLQIMQTQNQTKNATRLTLLHMYFLFWLAALQINNIQQKKINVYQNLTRFNYSIRNLNTKKT